MDSEEQTLRFYLSLFSFFFIIIYFIYLFNYKSIELNKNFIYINKDESISNIANKITKNENFINKNLFTLIIYISNNFISPINYGKFLFQDKASILHIVKVISTKSNYDYKLTFVEGWEEYQLNEYLLSYYTKIDKISYNNLISNTYIINSSNSFKDLQKFLLKKKNDFFIKYQNNELVKKYGIENILIISSLVEKEANNNEDKSLIASVIFNRLNINMKLQIDATVIYSITEGLYKINRKLTYDDLKIKHPSNTYVNNGLPPNMISYVGNQTIKIVLENIKSDYLFYFYNIIEKKHIFSKNFKDHRYKLNEYRQEIK